MSDYAEEKAEKTRAYFRAYYIANADEAKARGRARYAERRDELLAKVHSYRKANLEKIRAKDRARIDPQKAAAQRIKREQRDPTLPMIYSARKRARDRGMEFNLVAADVKIPSHCPVLGIALKRGVGTFGDASPTIDRIVNSRGYLPDNVRVISHRANRLKSDATLAELRALVEFYAGLES